MTVTQAVAALAAFAVLACYPPADGFLLLVPITAAAARSVPTVALNAGATVIAPGPWRGSLIVHGRRDRMATPAGLLVMAAPAAICGAGSAA